MDDAEIKRQREIRAKAAPLGTPTIISQRSTRHKGPTKYRSNEDILREEAAKVAAKWGFELSSVADELPEETRQAIGLGETVVEPQPELVVEPEPIIEEPKPTFTQQRLSYIQAGMSEDDANRLAAEDVQEGNLPVEQPVEREIVDDGSELLSRIAQMQKAPTQHKQELAEAMSEARQKGLLR